MAIEKHCLTAMVKHVTTANEAQILNDLESMAENLFFNWLSADAPPRFEAHFDCAHTNSAPENMIDR